MTVRKRTRKSRLDDFIRWKITQLAKYGGFSHRYIASLVFEKPFGRVSAQEVACVAGYLSRHKIRVSDWRRGKTAQASSFAQKAIKPKQKDKRLLFPKQRRRRAAA